MEYHIEADIAKETMLRKLREKQQRVKELERERESRQSTIRRLSHSLQEIGLLGLCVLLLVCGIFQSGGIGWTLIGASGVAFVLFVNQVFGGHLIRASQIISAFVWAISVWTMDWAVYPLRRLSGWRVFKVTYEAGEKPLLARRFMMAFQYLGPTFIKLGQMISMGAVVPRSWMSEFSKLCDYLPTESYDKVQAVIEKELGAPVEELFAYIDPNPIGAASLAQVHCVVLKDGRDAVVKVQRPNLKDRLERDYRIMAPMAELMEVVFGVLGKVIKVLADIKPVEILLEYGRATATDETDFAYEGTIMQMTRNALDRHGLSDQLHVPSVYWEYTTDSLLTMERIWVYFKLVDMDIGKNEEVRSYLDFLKSIGYDTSLAMKKAYRAWWWPFSRYGLVNIDVHHGNFLYSYDDAISLVDFGINYWGGSGPDSEKIRAGITQLWRGVQSSNYEDVVEAVTGNWGLLDGVESEEAFQVVVEEWQKFLEPIINCPEQEGMTGEFITDFTTYMTSGAFVWGLIDMLRGIAKRGQVHFGYEKVATIRMVPYWATWMEIVDPSWNLFTEGESLQGYYFSNDDGNVPYKGTNVYPSPPLPYEPDIWIHPRRAEAVRAEDNSLCFSPAFDGGSGSKVL